MPLLTSTDAPLVSIIIINHNCGRFIQDAIRSVMAQDYGNIECIIADNGSDDNSVEAISALIADRPAFKLVRFEENLGQLGALFQIFGQTGGEFVTLLDADDVLMPSFVASHVQVHLGLEKPVAFTSANIVEMDAEGRLLTGGFQLFGSPLLSNSPALAERSAAVRIAAISDGSYDLLSSHVSVIPFLHPGWFWSPGSANMYRRSVLKLVMQTRSPAVYLRAADSYLNPFCHALGGSALIDMRLSRYRIHGSNYFAVHEKLQGMRNGRPEFEAILRDLAGETAGFILSDCRRFCDLLGKVRFWDLLKQVSHTISGQELNRLPAFRISLANHLRALRKTFGDKELAKELSRCLPPLPLMGLLAKAGVFQFSPRFAMMATRYALRGKKSKRRRGHAVPSAGRKPASSNYGPVAVISTDPPIIMTGIAYDEWIGIAGAYGQRFGNTASGFIIYPTWTIEDPAKIAAIGRAARAHMRRYPNHRLIYMGNTQREADMLTGEGLTALFLNKNFTVSERIFRPLPEAKRSFDAIYNARFIPEKRHELASLIGSVAYVGYLDQTKPHWESQQDAIGELLRLNPGHELLNPIQDGCPVRLSPQETNACLNRAWAGLCLSEVEGTNNASMEYMLAGLGVVSTPSQGGRDVYFDPEFCIVCDASPASVQRAVAEIKARNIPGDYIRGRTLKRIDAERRRFLALVDDLRRQLGGAPANVTDWPFTETSGVVRWDHYDAHLQNIERNAKFAGHHVQLAVSTDLVTGGLNGIQLQPAELAPIIHAIRSTPFCALLVFGCGCDSPFWESINRHGTTVFLEDNDEWIAKTRAVLRDASVEKVHYGTRTADWSAMLGADEKLALDLPPSVSNRKWNVILVDGPAGYTDDCPGRMKSIFTASRLAAPNGYVFVHDCDRPLEREYSARYLGQHRCFVSVAGRSILNGYAF
jgi:uncharacterized protein (TIGR01627 family)